MNIGDIVSHASYPGEAFQVSARDLGRAGAWLVRCVVGEPRTLLMWEREMTLVAEAMMESGSVGDDESDPMVAALNEALGSIDEAMEALKEARRLVEDCVPRYA